LSNKALSASGLPSKCSFTLVDNFSVQYILDTFFVPFYKMVYANKTLWLTDGRQNGRNITPFGSLLRHICGFSAYFVFGIAFAHI
jgi:hypothetical protein